MKSTQFRFPGHRAGWMDLEKQTGGIFQHSTLSTPRGSSANKAFFSQLLLLPTHFSHLERKVSREAQETPLWPGSPSAGPPQPSPQSFTPESSRGWQLPLIHELFGSLLCFLGYRHLLGSRQHSELLVSPTHVCTAFVKPPLSKHSGPMLKRSSKSLREQLSQRQ